MDGLLSSLKTKFFLLFIGLGGFISVAKSISGSGVNFSSSTQGEIES